MTTKQYKSQGDHDGDHSVTGICSVCGTTINGEASPRADQVCLICHARLLNDYFQRVRRREVNSASATNE